METKEPESMQPEAQTAESTEADDQETEAAEVYDQAVESTEEDKKKETAKVEEQGAGTVDNENLQDELDELRSYKAEAESKKTGRRRWRRLVVALLIVLGCVVAAGANVTVWLKSVALDTDTWVSTVGPLSRNPAVALAISDFAVDALFQEIDAEQTVAEALPEEAAFLTAPLVGAMENFATDVAAEVISSDVFSAIWTTANRLTHEAALSLLRDEGGLFYISQGEVTIDFSDLLDAVADQLASTGLSFLEDLPITEESGKIVVYEAAQLAEIQQALNLLDRAGILLPLLALLAFGIAIWVSLWRRRTVVYIGAGLSITMALSLLVFSWVRSQILAEVSSELYRDAVEAVWQIIIGGLIGQTILLLVIGLAIAAGAFLAGPDRRAVAVRSAIGDFMGDLGDETSEEMAS